MPAGKKGSGKSSASSATRKKQAAKAAKKAGGDAPGNTVTTGPAQRGQKKDKKSKKEPKKKVFIPPPKPPQAPPDPLDTLGLAALLPPGLVVVLRKAAKKDVITRTRALEGLVAWIEGADEEGESSQMGSEERQSALVMMLPSWVHLFPRLAASPTRRLRLLTAQIMAKLLSPDLETRSELLQSPQYIETYIGPWAILSYDTDRLTANAANKAWDKSVSWTTAADASTLSLLDNLPTLINYLSHILIHGASSEGTSHPSLIRARSSVAGSVPGQAAELGIDAKTRDESNVEEDASTTDARMAAGALGALTWVLSSKPKDATSEELDNLLHASILWRVLEPVSADTAAVSRLDFPMTRSRGWNLLSVLTSKQPELLQEVLPIVAPIMLQAAWEERDAATQLAMLTALQPVLLRYNEAWSISADEAGEESDEESESDDEGSASEGENGRVAAPESTHAGLAVFERWLQMACGGQPRQALPYVPVLVTTIPTSLLPHTEEAVEGFLDTFWSSYESGLYTSDRVATAEFMHSFADTAAYFMGKVSRSSPDGAGHLAASQFGKVIENDLLPDIGDQTGSESKKALPSKVAAARAATSNRIVQTLKSLYKLDDAGSAAIETLDLVFGRLEKIAGGDIAASQTDLASTCEFLEALASKEAPVGLQSLVSDRVRGLASGITSSGEEANSETDVPGRLIPLLTELIQRFPGQTAPEVKDFALQSLPRQIHQHLIAPSQVCAFVIAYLRAAASEDGTALLTSLTEAAACLTDSNSKVAYLQGIMDGLERAGVPDVQLVADTKLDNVVLEAASSISAGSASASEGLLRRLLRQPKPFIDDSTVNEALALLISRLHGLARREEPQNQHADATLIGQVSGTLADWLGADSSKVEHLEKTNLLEGLTTTIFLLHFIDSQKSQHVASIWSTLSRAPQTHAIVTELLRGEITTTQLTIGNVFRGASEYFEAREGSSVGIVAILPRKEDLEETLLAATAKHQPPLSLSLLDPLLPLAQGTSSVSEVYDAEGFSVAVRVFDAVLLCLQGNRTLASSSPHLIIYLVLLAILCEDEIQASGGAGGLFDSTRISAPRSVHKLRDILVSAVKVSSGALSAMCGTVPESWHQAASETLRKGVVEQQSEPVLEMLATLWRWATTDQVRINIYLPRIFSRLLSGILSFTSAGEKEATHWLRLSSAIESKYPHLSEAIIAAAKPLVYGTPFFDRQCNDIVSRLASTPPPKANTEGLRLLKLANLIAPPQESDLALVPQQRAVFLLQGIGRWMASDEEFEDEINTRLVELFISIVPIVQEMPGSHLDLFYDLIESNLEVSSSLDDASIPGLYHTLRLLELLSELAERNAMLREVWKEHQESVLDLLRPIFASLSKEVGISKANATSETSLAKEMTAELVIGLVQRHYQSFQSEEDKTQFLRLLQSSMREVQSASYRLLSGSIRSSVSELVFESALEREGEERKTSVTLSPRELVESVREPIIASVDEVEDDGELSGKLMTYLLSWLAIFEHFEEASLQMKSVYAGQLQAEGLVSGSLLPTIFALLEPQRSRRTKGVGQSAAGANNGPFDPERYGIEEIYLDLLEPSESDSLRQLATHIYYRSLLYTPTLVREWWLSIKDRQLSMGVTNFTTRHCSPLITSRELGHLREPEAMSRLQDEAMSVKVIGSNEVVATYVVDEHPMEIGVRIPLDYPLHGVEVRDIRRVGVSEAQWRAWLLAVQQLIVGQNGLVVDALTLFKRNAEAKFQGITECAICYSVVSPMDRSLPKFPCPTCKHIFHSGCIYKWVHSSQASTCPLCRSIL